MLETVESPYYMFCDQDDVWLPQKIEITYQEMLEIEVQTAPCLVHTNLIITDSELHALEKELARRRIVCAPYSLPMILLDALL